MKKQMKFSLLKKRKIEEETENYVLSNADTQIVSTLTSSGREIKHTLHRLIAKRDFGKARLVKKGEVLGYVESKKNLAGNAIVDIGTLVYGKAVIKDNAYVLNSEICDASVENFACIEGSTILGKVCIYDNALIENTQIQGSTEVFDNVQIRNSKIQGNAKLYDNAVLDGAKIQGCAEIYDHAFIKNSTIQGHACIFDRARIENSTIQGSAFIHDRAKVKNSVIQDNANVHDQAYVCGSTLRGEVEIGGKEKIEGQTICDKKSIYTDEDLARSTFSADPFTSNSEAYAPLSMEGESFSNIMRTFNKSHSKKLGK